ncbi:unnamed protein product [Dovyalis caffra]|uniref:Uncharacterized protein n=1 Tax=Dovyalis caffra TaxID=77055 RepID=A0AAV1R195_9ROSI|nr:unnamed protein product [Dovyalis caffra]
MYPSKQDTGHEMNPKSPPTLQAPVTGFPVGPSMNQHYSETNAQYPIEHEQEQHGRWSSGLCDCFSDIPNCCITCWCPCITFGQVAEIVDRGTIPCAVSGAIYGVLLWLTGCPCIYSCLYRTKMRKQLMFEDRPCNDCLIHFCCDACALCQEYRELKHRGFDMTIGWEGNVQRQNGGVAMAQSAPVVEEGMKR